jgi:pyruvate dehydrogenase E2 component (dihydrolipoamide acetyltransferase)
MADIDFFTPIVNAPQTAILAVGRATQQPVIVDGEITVGWRMWTNLAVDHRVADGMTGARFVTHFQDRMNRLPQEVKSA